MPLRPWRQRTRLAEKRWQLSAKAGDLAAGHDAAVSFVRDHVGIDAYPGVLRGARGAFLSRRGNAWDRALLRSAHSPRAIEILPTGEAVCVFANGVSAAVEAVGGSGINRYWVALRLRGVALHLRSPWRRSLLVTAGMQPADAARLLRLWALWGKLPDVAPRQRAARS